MKTSLDINKIFCAKRKTLGAVESYTGGSFASDITNTSGASKFFKGSLVTYATEEKNRILYIPYEVIDKYGVVSKQVAIEMARNGRKLLNVDYCVAFTGNAGPTAMENKPVGRVYIAIADYKTTRVTALQIKGTRKQIKDKSISIAYDVLYHLLNKN